MSTSKKDNDHEKGTKVPFLLSAEKISLADIAPLLLVTDLSEVEHVKNIKELSSNFTISRNKITNYVLSRELVSSYAYFYLPTNSFKFYFLLDQLSEEIKNTILNSSFIDVGTGPGTYSYSFSSISPEGSNLYCVDSSSLMLEQAEKILVKKFKNNNFKFLKRLDYKIENSTLFFGNSINEIGIQNALDIVNISDSNIVMFIEPGTSQLFNELKNFREAMLKDYEVIYPCNSSEKCSYDWCHQVLRIAHLPCVERLSQLVSLDRKILPMAAHVYIKKSLLKKTKNDERAENILEMTLIRFLLETKYSFIYEACHYSNNSNDVIKIEVLKNKMTKTHEKKFKNINIGERILFSLIKIVGDTWRGHAL